MAGKRAYDDPCGIARALDVVGERWALLVVRELVLGPKRFTDLRTGLRGVSTDVLAQRLRQLEQAGVLRHVTLPPPGATRAYELTDRGHDLEPVLHALGRWGGREPLPAADREMTVDAFAVALSTVFDPARARGLDATVALVVDGDPLAAEVHDGTLELRRGTPEHPQVRIEGSVRALREVLWRGRPLAEAEADGSVVIGGLRLVVRRFLKVFPAPLPRPAATSSGQ
jgi:DNA-binding HxlR family transcriptional regulator